MDTKSISSTYCISVIRESCRSNVGVAGNIGCTGLQSHFKSDGEFCLKLSPCGTPTVDFKHWPFTSPTLADRLVSVSRVWANWWMSSSASLAARSETPGSPLLRVCRRPEIDLDTRSGIPCLTAGPSSRSVPLQR